METKKPEWLEKIQNSGDLPEPYSTIAELIGVDNTLLLVSKMGGEHLYLPRLSTLRRQVRDKNIQNEYTGYNIRQLARKYRISVRRVQQLVKGLTPQHKTERRADYEQLSLFDTD